MLGSTYSLLTILASVAVILIDFKISTQAISGSPTVTVINANSAYNFAIVDPNLANQDGIITIGFPSTLYTLTTVSCYNSQSTTQTYPCSVVGGNRVNITYTRGTFPSSFLPIGITTIKNPPSKQSLNFTYLFSSGSTTISQAYILTDPLTPDSLTACSVSFSPSTVFTQATVIFNFTTKNQLDSNSSAYITFPTNWNNSASTSYTPFTTSTTGVTCTPISGSPLKTSLTCDSFSNNIQATSIFSANVNANTVIVFSATRVRTPPTVSAANTVVITTQTSSGYLVDQSICSVVAVTEQTLTITSTSSFVVGNSNSLTITWTSGSPLRVGDVFTIILPSSYMTFTQLTGIATLYQTTKLIGRTSVTSNSTQYRFTIASLTDSEISVGQRIQLSNFIAQCLVDTSPRLVNVQISRGGNNIAIGSLTVTPSPNLLSNVIIRADVTTVESAMALNITFSTTNILLQNSQLRIQVPSTITTIGSSPTCQISSSTSPSAILSTISCTVVSNVVSIPSFLSTTLAAGSSITIVISNIFRNPITTQPTSQFIISTVSSANFPIDQSSNITYSATTATIGSLTIIPNSYQVRATTDYILTYNIMRTIKSGSTIQVVIPSDISISASSSYSFLINSNTTYTTISPTISGSTLTFSGIITTQMITGSSIKIRFSNLINPISLKPTSSFQVTVSYLTYPTTSLTTGLIITMSTLASFRSVSAIVTDPKNGATKDYSFFIQPLIPLSTGDLIVLRLVDTTNSSNQIRFSGTTVTCSISYSNVTLSNTCSVASTTLTITLSGPLSDATGATQYLLIVSSFILARTPRTTSNFQLTTFTGGFAMQTTTVSSTPNTKANNIQTLTLQVLTLPSQLNQYEQLKLTFRTFNGIDLRNDEYFVIDIPNIFTYKAVTGSICTNNIFTCTLNSNYQIKVAKSASYSTIGFANDFSVTLNDALYVSPKDFNFNTQYFYVTTYTNDTLKIDETDPITITASRATFYRTCGGFCATCPSSSLSFCTTCYNSSFPGIQSSTYGGYNIKTSDNQCVDVCGTGFYIVNGTCTACVSPCNACINQTICTSCRSGTFFYQNTSSNATTRCWSVCPDSFYGDTATNICISCATSCKTCTVLSTTCTSCPDLYYLSGTSCTQSCPAGTFQNSLTNRCQACDAGCLLECTNSATDCISCKPSYVRLSSSSNACVNTCPAGSVKITPLSICGCTSPCGTCSGIQTNCSTCINSSYILYNNNCIQNCPAQTYNSSNVCINCVDPSCSLCNVTHCFICSSNYYVYDGRCVLTCPEGTRANNPECSFCPTGCRTCITSTTCTSCFPGFLINSGSCVTSCPSGTVNFNASECLSACPAGYISNGGVCQIQTSNNTSNNTTPTTENTTQSLGRIVPFPYTIGFVVIIGISIGMRCLYPITLLPSTLMSLGSILQIMSAITLMIVAFIQFGSLLSGIGIVVITVALIYVSNVVNLLFIIKVLNNDEKFMRNYKRKVSPNIVIRIISVLTYHKFHQIVFSNIFGVKVFCNKVDYVRRLYPFNILLIISLFFSLLLIIGASLIGYQVQTSLLSSPSFIQSVDCIIIVVLNVIPTILVLRRKDTAYEVQIDDKQAKRYQTQDQLNMQNESQGIQQVFIEEGGGDLNGKASKVSQRRKNYYYQNSKRSQGGEDTHQNPLDKKRTSTGNPINSNPQDGEHSSQALLFGKKTNKNQTEEISEGIQQIVLQEAEGDNLSPPPGRKIINTKLQQSHNSMINYVGYDLEPRLLQLPQNSQQFKKLPSQTKAKIRLAKANIQINKNSSIIKKQNISLDDLQQIQLSPKKNTKQDFFQQNAHSQFDQNYGSRKNLLNDSIKNQRQKDQNLRSKSKQKQKNKSKQKDKSPKRSKSKSPERIKRQQDANQLNDPNNQKQEGLQDAQQERMNRNRSEQMKKKDSNGMKTTKSQNITKRKKKPNNQIKVLFNSNQIQNLDDQNNINENDDEFQQEDQPRLPVFQRSKIRGRDEQGHLDYQSDGLENNEGSKKDRYKRPLPSQRKSQNLQDQNVKNLRDIKGQRTIPNQQPDDLPNLHSSQQLANLVVVNRKLKSKRPGELQFSNDDSSIYNKIYNDEQQTLKSVQGDNFFGQQVSPSQFNVQNQRFQQTQASNQMPIPATFEIQVQDYEDNEDGFDQYDSNGKKRYSSNNNIDYDSVLSKRLNNDKIKKLQQIYLPRLDVVKPRKKKK